MKKIYIFLLLLSGMFTAAAQQPVSFAVQADADDWQLYMSSRLMEDFNSNSKVVFITLTAGDEGNGVAAFNGATVPYYIARENGGVYGAKFACDISVNGNACTIETVPAQQVAVVNGHSIVKYVYKNSVSYFLRLPDGGFDGEGFAATGLKSLEKLENEEISSLTSVDGVNTYNGWSDLTETILAIINTEKSNANLVWLHTGSLDEGVNANDHSDHVHAAMAAKDATEYLSWVGYVDYVNDNSATLPNNLSISKFQDAAAFLGMADYALIESKYNSKLTAANIALLGMDYYTTNRTPSACEKTDNLTTTGITASSATLRWKKIAGAVGYQVEYKSTGSWISAGDAVVDSFVTITNLAASTAYQWRVRTKCLSNGNGSGFTQAQFTTAVALTCTAPTGLNATNITTSSVKVNWTAVVGAASYVLEGKASTSSTWIVVGTTSSNTYNVSGLAASTTYDWRVKTNCSNGTASAVYGQSQFTTQALCTDILEYNNSFYYAKAITPGLNYNAQIASCYDKDYYKFSNTAAAKNIKVTLTNLPADYDVKVYNQWGCLVDISQNWGTTSETIIINTTSSWAVGTYRVYVYGYAGAYSSSKCYNLKVEISSTAFSQSAAAAVNMRGGLEKLEGSADDENVLKEVAAAVNNTGGDKTQTSMLNTITDVNIYPMPVYDEATIAFEGGSVGKAYVTVLNATGKQVKRVEIAVAPGHNAVKINLLSLASGVYTINIKYGLSNVTKQVVISR